MPCGSAQAEVRQDDTNDDDEAYDVDDGVHGCSFSLFSGAMVESVETYRCWTVPFDAVVGLGRSLWSDNGVPDVEIGPETVVKNARATTGSRPEESLGLLFLL